MKPRPNVPIAKPPIATALREIEQLQGQQFDPRVVAALRKVVEQEGSL